MRIAGIRGIVGLGAVLALGIGLALALPATEAQASHCGDTENNTDEARNESIDISNEFGSESICPALCRRTLTLCRYLARREIGCHRGNIAQRLARNQIECRLQDPGKARQDCRAGHRSNATSSFDEVRSEFRQQLEDCESAVNDNCNCGD
jgi:hypothetical protein